jgi:hypothetical protein
MHTTALDDMLFYGANDCKSKMRAMTEANAAFSEVVGRLNHHSLMTCRSMVDTFLHSSKKEDAMSRTCIKERQFAANMFFYSVGITDGRTIIEDYVPESPNIPLSSYNQDTDPLNAAQINIFTAINDLAVGLELGANASQPVSENWEALLVVLNKHKMSVSSNAEQVQASLQRHLLPEDKIPRSITTNLQWTEGEKGTRCIFWFPTTKDVKAGTEWEKGQGKLPLSMPLDTINVLVLGTVLDKFQEEDGTDPVLNMCKGMSDNSRILLSFFYCVAPKEGSNPVKIEDGIFKCNLKIALRRNFTADTNCCTRYVRLEHANKHEKSVNFLEPSTHVSRIYTGDNNPIEQVPIDEFIKDAYLHLVTLLEKCCQGKPLEAINICSCNTRATNSYSRYCIQTTIKVNYKCTDMEARTETLRLTYIIANYMSVKVLHKKMGRQANAEGRNMRENARGVDNNKRGTSVADRMQESSSGSKQNVLEGPVERTTMSMPCNEQGLIFTNCKQLTDTRSLQWGKDMQSWTDVPCGMKQTATKTFACAKDRQKQQLHGGGEGEKLLPSAMPAPNAKNAAAATEVAVAVQAEEQTKQDSIERDASLPSTTDAAAATEVAVAVQHQQQGEGQQKRQPEISYEVSPPVKVSTLQSFLRPRRDIASAVAAMPSVPYLPAEVTPEGSQRMACFQYIDASASANVKLMSSARHS